MKTLILLLTLFHFLPARGQIIHTGEGDFMDTTSSANIPCNRPMNWHYSVGGKYPESPTRLLKRVNGYLVEKKIAVKGNGYITFRFTIDCNGRMLPKVELLQTDEKYIATHFNKDLVGALYHFLKSLNEWKVAQFKTERYPYFSFMSFKISDGKVFRIIP